MLRRSITFIALVLAGALLLSASSSAFVNGDTQPFKFKTIYFSYAGPFGVVKPGANWEYDFGAGDVGHNRLSSIRLDIYLPQQKIDPRSVRLGELRLPSAGASLIGNHLRWTVKNLSPHIGVTIILRSRVLPSAKGQICNKLLLTYNKKVGNYSPPCIRVVK